MTHPRPDPAVPHEVDFQHIPTGGFFAECTHPNRAAAEAFAVDKLIDLGEDPTEANEAVKLAGYTAADAHAYAVRIYPTRT
ncbi:hypothetical protein [Rhodococcus sp. B50]|uniref:hypothetical protein n=1 Tax=Rhodococcus sp. B50 TaxID=2682847 RepID=UPI0019F43895|nr:hypothetical protein [Rhodococcus sp. B50]MBS9371067.1 hypothetical protein [Rhodococcus sp. B50]